MTASLTPNCPVCDGLIQALGRGRPAIYCSEPCNQTAHREHIRPLQARQELERLRRRLAPDVGQLTALAAELDQAQAELDAASAAAPPARPVDRVGTRAR